MRYMHGRGSPATRGGMFMLIRSTAACAAALAAGLAIAGTLPAQAQTAAKPTASDAVFPNTVDPKYSKEKGGTARMHTCRDQYNANKANGGNGGLKWIQKGGGYYSECTKRLKA